VLSVYPGAVLFVSHDREFTSNIADRIILLKNKTALVCEDPNNILEK
jgi:ATPase subunit of ABC transporter with duplicated ATPase domains